MSIVFLACGRYALHACVFSDWYSSIAHDRLYMILFVAGSYTVHACHIAASYTGAIVSSPCLNQQRNRQVYTSNMSIRST